METGSVQLSVAIQIMPVDQTSDESNSQRTRSRIWGARLFRCNASSAIFCSAVSSIFIAVNMILIFFEIKHLQ